MVDETSQTREEKINEQEHVSTLPVEFNSNDFVQKFKEISLLEKEQKASASLPGSPASALDGVIRPTGSRGHTNTGVGRDNPPEIEIRSSHPWAGIVTQLNSNDPACWICSGKYADAG